MVSISLVSLGFLSCVCVCGSAVVTTETATATARQKIKQDVLQISKLNEQRPWKYE